MGSIRDLSISFANDTKIVSFGSKRKDELEVTNKYSACRRLLQHWRRGERSLKTKLHFLFSRLKQVFCVVINLKQTLFTAGYANWLC